MGRKNANENQSQSPSLSSKKGMQEPSRETCEICGSVGIAGLMMICFKCRHSREHTYCGKVFLPSVPDMWLCEACRPSSPVLRISHLAEDLMDSVSDGSSDPKNTSNSREYDHGAATLRTNDMEEEEVDIREASTSCDISANVNTVMHLPSHPHTSPLAKETLSSQNKEEQQQHQPTQGFPKKRRTIRVLVGKHLSQSHDPTLNPPRDQSASPKCKHKNASADG